MPIHDWSRVESGVFHDFHHGWIAELHRALNHGLLPNEYYAMAEQSFGEHVSDTLKFQRISASDEEAKDEASGSPATPGSLALAPPPAVCYTAVSEMAQYVAKQNSVVIRHVSGDRVVALIEVVSPGNKASRHALQRFVEKTAGALHRGRHLLILDLIAPATRDPNGIHGAI
ncbi:MAG TPA: DUF4058 family protein [Planctomycetaceae bacterium]|jgi:hypothetical protein